MARGIVKFWKSDKGWGAIMSDALPSGSDAFAHFSVIEADGYRELEAGDLVDFDFEPARQDSFDFRVTRVVRVAGGPAPVLTRREDGSVEAEFPQSQVLTAIESEAPSGTASGDRRDRLGVR